MDDVNNDVKNRQMSTDSVDIEAALLRFIIKDRQPISRIESPHLNNLVNGMLTAK